MFSNTRPTWTDRCHAANMTKSYSRFHANVNIQKMFCGWHTDSQDQQIFLHK